MFNKKKSLFEKITGSIRFDDEDEIEEDEDENPIDYPSKKDSKEAGSPTVRNLTVKESRGEKDNWFEEEPEGQLTVDVYQTPGEIIIQTMVAGVRPEDLGISIARDTVTIKGRREENKAIPEQDYFTRELYWGAFSRTIILPQEIEPDRAEAIEKHGLLTIRLPKIDKGKQTTIKVKSL